MAFSNSRCLSRVAPSMAQAFWWVGLMIRACLNDSEASGILRYIQVHRALDEELNALLTEPRGTRVEPYMGHAELWFDHSDARRSPERTEANRVAIEDESSFIDFRRSAMWLAKEHVFVDRR